MTKSTEVLEEVANDLIRMGDEIEQQISSAPSETKSADKTAPNLIDKTLILVFPGVGTICLENAGNANSIISLLVKLLLFLVRRQTVTVAVHAFPS